MKKSIVALAFGTFALGIAEFVIMGILGNLAEELSVSITDAGHLISAYATGVAVGAPTLIILRKMPLKNILVLLAGMILAGNLLTSLAPNYWCMVVARFLSGLPHGAYFGVSAIVAQRLADAGYQARAVSVMVAGMTIATIVGVPVGTFLSDNVSWRVTFGLVALSAAVTLVFVHLWVPQVGKVESEGFKSQFRFLRNLAPWLILSGVFFGQTGLYCWYSYIDPLLTKVSGFAVDDLSWLMALAGLGMFTGNIVSGRLADRYSAGIVSGAIAAVMVPVMVLAYVLAGDGAASAGLMFLGTAGLFGIGGPLQYLIVKYSKGGEMLGAAGIQIAFNVGNAVAAAIGGWVINVTHSYRTPALAGIPLLVVSAVALYYLYCHYERGAKRGE